MSVKTDVAKLFAAFAGQGNTLTIPRPYLTVCENDHRAALLLSQCVYWSDRTDNADGWFVKSYADWLEELGMSEYEVRRAAKVLAPMGLETVVRKSRFHEGAPTLHYRVNMDKLSEFILKFLQYPEPLRNLRIEGKETEVSYTETISETTEETTSVANNATGGDSNLDTGSKENPTHPTPRTNNENPPSKVPLKVSPRPRDVIFDAVCMHVFGITDDVELKVMNESDDVSPRIGGIASWLKGTSDKVSYNKVKKTVGFISAPAKPEHVKAFAAWYVQKHPTASMVTDGEKFVEYWRKWASSMKAKAQPRPTAAQPDRPTLTDDQLKQRQAELAARRNGVIA